MIVVMFLKPKWMLIMSITGCLFATTLISLEGAQNSLYLFVGAALYGLAISWHFGAGVSWTAENMDIVVRTYRFLNTLDATFSINLGENQNLLSLL